MSERITDERLAELLYSCPDEEMPYALKAEREAYNILESNSVATIQHWVDRTDAAIASADEWRIKCEKAKATVARYELALDQLARLGNGNLYGNSDGNRIAQAALKEQP